MKGVRAMEGKVTLALYPIVKHRILNLGKALSYLDLLLDYYQNVAN
ncbi:MAG: hypothetical protein H0U73_04330 [Tatlockia sp.]|nr:hypothetical protein [Tatlockia sp.]